jgi:dGTPase
MLSAQVYDVIAATQTAVEHAHLATLDDVRRSGPLVQFGDEMRHASAALKSFLFHQLYRHPQVMQTTQQAKTVVKDLFDAYLHAPAEMQAGFAMRANAVECHGDSDNADAVRARVVADYIAGMTDRFAVREHARLTGKQLLL